MAFKLMFQCSQRLDGVESVKRVLFRGSTAECADALSQNDLEGCDRAEGCKVGGSDAVKADVKEI
jgi:hypothetical protein